LAATLVDIRIILGERQVVVARELTKLFEELLSGSTVQVCELVQDGRERGEVVILIAPADEGTAEAAGPSPQERLQQVLDKGHTVKEAAALVAAATGLPRRELYAQALLLQNRR
jgi:16S rRNA (cytidine1402-2'-O)-methyltransferase